MLQHQHRWSLSLLLAWPGTALAGRGDVGGYFRIMTRPDLQGGSGTLGYWNLYGRLLNEGPYAALEFRFDVLEPQPGTDEMWTSLHAKIEGASIGNADAGNGSFDQMRLSQVYARAGNVLARDVVWQVGTLDTYFGDLGLFDMRPAEIFYETVGLSARVRKQHAELLVGFGDSGWNLYGEEYNTVFTPGATLRVRPGAHVELGLGGQAMVEPAVQGSTHAPYQTPGIDYEDFVRGEIALRYLEQYPGLGDYFPDPEPRDALSYKTVGYLGFGGFGPVRWNNLYASFARLHPEKYVTESADGEDYTIYVHDLTDDRYRLLIGNELQLTIWPEHLDAAWGVLYGNHRDLDNQVAPSEFDRSYASTVLRLQAYASESVHVLVETSLARETSRNGNTYRDHKDSIFANTGGVADSDGLEYGDADQRDTWQGKAGFVLNPLGQGIYTRPSLRVLYGVQYSTQNNAFGNSFVDTLDQYSSFEVVEQHLHHVIALETEVWF